MNLSTSNPRFSQFVEFTVQPHYAAPLTDALLARAERSTSLCPGFINCTIHMNEQDNRVFMHVFWVSRDAAERAIEQLKNVEPDLFNLALQHNASALLFSAYNAAGEVCAHRDAQIEHSVSAR